MSLKLEALSPVEGVGIVRVGDVLRLLRPPYLSHDASVLAEEALHDAIFRCGFTACEMQFDRWEDVINFLNQQVAAVRRAMGRDVPETIPPRDILDVAPVEMLNRFLDRVEQELLPQRSFEYAEDFLLTLLISDARANYPDIGTRAVMLLQRIKDARKQLEADITRVASHDIRFASLEKHGEVELGARLAEVVRERGFFAAAA